ncbi:hypothetical protein V9T40_006488 [Parthenolecanium corni]|uniref:RRM domain-containing protein n=1 Tax=Parthenolecanium corni TaxID=536013 RepID=A0AAN9TKW1_9HEMI
MTIIRPACTTIVTSIRVQTKLLQQFYETPPSPTLSGPNQQKYTSAILNLIGKENLGMTLNSNGLESPIGNMYQSAPIVENDALELQAKYHRSAQQQVSNAVAQFAWSVKLPKRSFKREPYSSKVFLGGVPWDITEEMLICSFHQFGNVKVEWPVKDSIAQPKGYAYIICENEMQMQLDAYLEETPYSPCHIQLGSYFCRENGCFWYFCTNWWSLLYASLKFRGNHAKKWCGLGL